MNYPRMQKHSKLKKNKLLKKHKKKLKKKRQNLLNMKILEKKIGGAKKDIWQSRGLDVTDLESMNDREAGKYVKKDNIWRKDNYEEMIKSGTPVDVVYFIKKVRDSLDVKPFYLRKDTAEQTKARQEEYINFIKIVQNVLGNVKTKEDALQVFERILLDNGYVELTGNSYSKYQLTDKAKTNYTITNKFLKAIQKSERSYQWEIVEKAKKEQFGIPKDDKLPKGFSVHFNKGDGYSANGQWKPNTYYVSKGNFIVQTNFDTEAEAIKWLQEYAKKKPTTGKTRFVPEQLQDIKREGIDYRNDKDVDGNVTLELLTKVDLEIG